MPAGGAPPARCLAPRRTLRSGLLTWQEADEDGSGELDIEEFTQKLGPHLGQHLSEAQIAQLFLKVRARGGGLMGPKSLSAVQRETSLPVSYKRVLCAHQISHRRQFSRPPNSVRVFL